MKIKEKLKRTLCILLSSLMMVVSPVSSAFTNVQEVEAAAAGTLLGAGALSLFEMMCGALGVTFTGMYAAYKTDLALQFIQALRDGDADAMADAFVKFDPATAKKLTLTTKCWDTLKSLLSDKFGNLKSGKQSFIKSSDYSYGSFNSVQDKIFEYGRTRWDLAKKPYICYAPPNSNSIYYWYYGIGDYDTSLFDKYVVAFTVDSSISRITFYKNNGAYYGVNDTSWCCLKASVNTDGSCTLDTSGTHYGISYVDGLAIRSSIPIIIVNNMSLDTFESNKFSLNEILESATMYSNNVVSSASWGTYDEKNIDALTDKEIPADAIEKIVGTINSTVTDNTTTSDTGEIIYSDAIGDAVAKAVTKALTDAGVIAGAGTDTGTDTGGKDDTETSTGILAGLASILAAVKTNTSALQESVQGLKESAGDKIMDVVYAVHANTKSLVESVNATRDAVNEKIMDVVYGIQENAKSVVESVEGVGTKIADIAITFPTHIDDIKEKVIALPKAIADALANLNIFVTIKEGWDTLWEWLAKILDGILAIPGSIADVIATALSTALTAIFVPNLEDVAVVDEVMEKFDWIGDLYTCVKKNLTSLNPDTEPPVIYIDFTKGSSKYVPVGKRVAIDFSWYAPYKPMGDKIVGSFMWIIYLWYLFKRIPDIISGGGMLYMGNAKFDDAMSKKAEREGKE